MKLYPYKLLVIVACHFIIFSVLGISRHWGYMTSINDLGCFDQAIWGLIHKGFMLNSFGHADPINWLGHHFNPILYFFVPLYYLIPTVSWFIFAQSAALALTALPIFSLAKQVTTSEKQALLWSIIYLFNPFVLNADAWDFHPVSLAVPLIAFAFLAIEQQNISLFTFCNILLLLCQEQFGLTVACFGLLYGIKNREKKVSSLFFVLGVAVFIVVLAVIMPALSPTKQHIMFGEADHPEINRYGWLGSSFREVIYKIIFSPLYILKILIFQFEWLSYFNFLFFPFLFTALAAPFFLLPLITDFFVNSLSSMSFPRSIYSYHSVTLIPILTISAIYGCQKISWHFSLLPQSRLTGYICIVTVICGYLFSPLPLPFAADVWGAKQVIAQYDFRESEIKSIINERDSISVQRNIGAHFSQREKVYIFPDKLSEVDYVVIWLSYPKKINDYFSTTYNEKHVNYIQIHPRKYLEKIEMLLVNRKFNIVYWNNPWLVFKRETKVQDKYTNQVLEKINELKKQLNPVSL